jgi:hypothetical protein
MSNAGGSRTSRFRIARAKRGAEALELRLAGLSYAEIGRRMGVSPQRAFTLVSEELARINAKRAEAAAEVTRIELERLDRLLAAVWPQAESGELPAVDRVLQIMQRRARLLGIDLADRAPAAVGPGAQLVLNVQEMLVQRGAGNAGLLECEVGHGGEAPVGARDVDGAQVGNGHGVAAPGPTELPPE